MHLESARVNRVMALSIQLDQPPPEDLLGKAILELVESIPQGEVLYFHGIGEPVSDAYTQLPNLEMLYLEKMSLPTVFPGLNPNEDEGTLLSLQTLAFESITVSNNDWSPLTTFLTRRVFSGKRLDTLMLSFMSTDDHKQQRERGEIGSLHGTRFVQTLPNLP